MERFIRTENLIGKHNLQILQKSHVLVAGCGGVGGYVIEALARAGIGELTIIDNDVVSKSNINRQIIALESTVGKPKVEVMKQRLYDINPNIKVNAVQWFLTRENVSDITISQVDYVVDAIDNVTAKIALIQKAKMENKKVISCMGTGNKLDYTKFKIDDISKTSVCPLAKVMRKELKDRNIKGVKVLYSTENPVVAGLKEGNKVVPTSISFIPSIAGLMIAAEVIKDLINN